MKRHKTVDAYIEDSDEWQEQLTRLRAILNSTELQETVKWGGPCYVYDGRHVVGMGAFKSYCGLWFFQGALLQDKNQVLINAQEGKTKALRQWRFQKGDKINSRTIKSYVKEAIELVKQGREVKPDRAKPVKVPVQLAAALRKNKKAGAAFKELAKGKQREYADYIADAKREETKLKRIEKILPMISEKIGLNDKYRSC